MPRPPERVRTTAVQPGRRYRGTAPSAWRGGQCAANAARGPRKRGRRRAARQPRRGTQDGRRPVVEGGGGTTARAPPCNVAICKAEVAADGGDDDAGRSALSLRADWCATCGRRDSAAVGRAGTTPLAARHSPSLMESNHIWVGFSAHGAVGVCLAGGRSSHALRAGPRPPPQKGGVGKGGSAPRTQTNRIGTPCGWHEPGPRRGAPPMPN